MHSSALVEKLRSRVPGLLAVYAFGSRVQGMPRDDSDLDMAVLVAGYADPMLLWELSGELSEIAGCQVDLLDMRAASTVLQHQVLITGQRWWAADVRAGLFEAWVMSEKTELDRARAGLLADIQESGTIHGR